VAGLPRQNSVSTSKIFGIAITYDFWKTKKRLPIFLLVMPLIIAAVSIIFIRDAIVGLYLARLPLPILGSGALLAFFGFITLLPIYFGYTVWMDIKAGFQGFGERNAMKFLRTIRAIDITVYFSLFLIICMSFAERIPPVESQFNLASSAPISLATTVFFIYPWTLIFEVLVLIILRSARPNYHEQIVFSILSSLEDRRLLFADDIIKYFNRQLRWTGWKIRIKREVQLSPYFFSEPLARRNGCRRLLTAIDQHRPNEFVDALADIVHKAPAEILEKAYFVRDWNALIQTAAAIIAILVDLILSPATHL
jgi:hypothetical protein